MRGRAESCLGSIVTEHWWCQDGQKQDESNKQLIRRDVEESRSIEKEAGKGSKQNISMSLPQVCLG